jgi:hypothetical protein
MVDLDVGEKAVVYMLCLQAADERSQLIRFRLDLSLFIASQRIGRFRRSKTDERQILARTAWFGPWTLHERRWRL